MTDFCQTEASVRSYLQECHGDALYKSQICAVYDRIKKSNISLFQYKLINESSLSTEKVVSNLTLNKRDSNFLAIGKEVGTFMLKVINDCYGNFSDYTVPIFTQYFLVRLAYGFNTTLGRYYETISTMLNKHEKQV